MYALSNIKHNGNTYFRGDHIPELTEEQARRLATLGVVTDVKPTEPEPEQNRSLVLSDEERRANRKPKATEEEKKAEKKEEKKVEEKKVGKKAEKHANPDAL